MLHFILCLSILFLIMLRVLPFVFCSYIVKQMRNAADIKKAKQERNLAREMAEEEKRQKIAADKAKLVAKEIHQAATKIMTRYRINTAKKLVQTKRIERDIEKLKLTEKKYFDKSSIIQRNFRKYSTRTWFISRGVKFDLNRMYRRKRKPGDKRLSIDKPDLQGRIEYEIQQRRVNQRMELLYNFLKEYTETVEVNN